MQSISEWLHSLGLDQYVQVFSDNDVDLELLPSLSEQDLEKLGVSMGHRKKLLKAIAELNDATAAAPATTPETAAPSSMATAPRLLTDAGERRQLTVLFCDMVGFTELANRVDPEVLQKIIRSYEDACAVCITRYDGYVFQRLGDGIVAFFGYPFAHEGEAERAIHAGLQIIESLSKLHVADVGHVKVRIGIATGLVVVSAAEKSAVGETMNLASRLQAIAQPGSIVVSDRVHRLAGGNFEFEDLGEQSLKGIAQPTRAWRIGGLSGVASRFDAATYSGLTPLVGREQEIGLLTERWQLTREGEGQVVVLSGEPGIGKSRILSALRERLGSAASSTLHFQCSPYYLNSAFYPMIDHLERALKFGRDDTPLAKLDKLESLIVGKHALPRQHAQLLAALLSIPTLGRYEALALSPQQQKEDTIRALVDLTEVASRCQPTLMVVEDAHWADPTTLEVLDLLIDRVRDMPLLVIVTHRPEFQPKWVGHGHVTALALSRLSRAQSAAVVSRLAGGKRLPAQLLEQIIAKTDGVPLFVEEMTKSILETDKLKDAGDHYAYVGSAVSVTIPATLRDSLMARLDRVMPVKEIAQIGSAIGREFSYELIAAVAPIPTAALDDRLGKLVESGLAFRRGVIPEAVYTFKHALVQDAAYDSLLKTHRQELHANIARVLEQRFPAIKDSEPELLARHYSAAGLAEPAVAYWRLAAERASARFANTEAIAHARHGMAALSRVSRGAESVDSELALRMSLVASLRLVDRYDEALAELESAQALATEHKRVLSLARIHHTRGNIYFPLGQVERCFAEHQAALEFARQAHSTEDEARALGGICDAHYMSGQMQQAHDYADRCVSLCRAHGLEGIEIAYLPMRAATHMYCLRFAEALDDCRTVFDLAARVGQPRGEIVARSTSSWVLLEQHEFDQAEEHARRALDLVDRIGARRFVPALNDVLARIRLHDGDRAGAVELLENSWAIAQATSVTFNGPVVLGAVALATADPARRREALQEGQAILERGCPSHNYFWFYRRAIEVSLAEGEWDAADAYARALESYFHGESVPWADLIIARGRILADLGRRGPDDPVIQQLRRLRNEAARLGLKIELECFDAALQSARAT